MLKNALLVFALVSLSACLNDKSSLVSHTVKITNLSRNSGGSGVIIESTPSASHILTNAHVCGVVKQGGLVITEPGNAYPVVSYKVSEIHDLCLIQVYSNLGVSTSLGSEPSPGDYGVISGHPHLLPFVLTEGHFSGRIIVQVLSGMRECSEEEKRNPGIGLFCALLGGIPVVKTYESQLVTSLIQPGSSGSGVFDSSNNLVAVAFAGSGDLGYALVVPYEYVYNFLTKEIRTLSPNTPDYASNPFSDMARKTDVSEKLAEVCNKPKDSSDKTTDVERDAIKSICKIYQNDLIYRE